MDGHAKTKMTLAIVVVVVVGGAIGKGLTLYHSFSWFMLMIRNSQHLQHPSNYTQLVLNMHLCGLDLTSFDDL